MEEKIKLFMRKLREIPNFGRVKFIILYGSYLDRKQNKLSDIDFAIFYDGDKNQRFKFRLKLLSKLPSEFDVQIFQDLPLFIRQKVLKGKIIYTQDLNFVYDIAYATIKAFEDFKKYYYDYIERRPMIIW